MFFTSGCCSIKSLNLQILGRTETLVLKVNEIVSMIVIKVLLTTTKKKTLCSLSKYLKIEFLKPNTHPVMSNLSDFSRAH